MNLWCPMHRKFTFVAPDSILRYPTYTRECKPPRTILATYQCRPGVLQGCGLDDGTAAGAAPVDSCRKPQCEVSVGQTQRQRPASNWVSRRPGVLRGWGLDGALRPQERWSAARPAAAPALLAAVPRAPGEPLHTAAKVGF